MAIAMLALSISEGIMFMDKSGVDPKKFLEVLNYGYNTYLLAQARRKKMA